MIPTIDHPVLCTSLAQSKALQEAGIDLVDKLTSEHARLIVGLANTLRNNPAYCVPYCYATEQLVAAADAMLRRVRKVTGHTVEQIVGGYPKPIADAIQLLLVVGIIDAGKVYADICWEVCLEQATAAIQHRIARISEE